MVIMMATDMGKRIEDEFGAFEEEVLNAQWLPQPALQLGTPDPRPAAAPRPVLDIDAFLRTIYLAQE